MNEFCFINGEIKSISEGSINVKDLALQRGYGVFDFVRTYSGKLFHFEDHIERFKHSAGELYLKLNYTNDEIKGNAETLINKGGLTNPAIRLILTGGYSSTRSSSLNPNFIMIAEELPVYPKELYTAGAKLITVKYQRELPRAKTINYLNDIRLNPLRHENKAFDVLYYSENGITECPRNNFFIFKDDTLITPIDYLLLGVTRKVVLKIAGSVCVIEERKLELNELKTADEAFITSTTKGIMPVTIIDDNNIGSGKVGEKTKKLMELFEKYVADYKSSVSN